jgi:hypothetical protein
LALATLLGWRSMLTKVTVAYTLTSLPIFYVHHYWSTNTPASLVLVYALPPLLLPVFAWGYRHLPVRVPAVASRHSRSVRSEPGLSLE